MTTRPATPLRSIETWLDEMILCGFPYPVSRRRAAREMVENGGLDWPDAIKALCFYKAVQAN
jgi:hypothetical protein